HSQCGAMSALIDPEQVRGLPYLSVWLEHARAAAEILADGAEATDLSQRVDQAIRANVLVQLQNLRTHPSVAAGLQAGWLELHGWVYRFETGEVLAHDPHRNAFVPLRERYPEGLASA
ncbi:MAG: carbonic anhydrase, partial [Planctomycetota bacterium]